MAYAHTTMKPTFKTAHLRFSLAFICGVLIGGHFAGRSEVRQAIVASFEAAKSGLTGLASEGREHLIQFQRSTDLREYERQLLRARTNAGSWDHQRMKVYSLAESGTD